MGYKQPRVPQKQPGMSQEEYLRALTLFLKDFCMETWTAVTRGKKDGGEGGKGTVTSVNGEGPDEGGNVQLSAEDVGARPDSWTPSAADVGARPDTWTPSAGDVGALPADGKAKDSERLGGKNLSEIMLEIYPVGSIYTSIDSTSPASLFGGTWEQFRDRVLVGAGLSFSAGDIGGSFAPTVSPHTHSIEGITLGSKGSGAIRLELQSDGNAVIYKESGAAWSSSTSASKWSIAHGANIGIGSTKTTSAGSDNGFGNMPPYLAVYMWKRVS